VKDRQSYQPDGGSKNTADYDVLFILRVHRLIRLGYGRLQHVKYATCEETTITGDLVEAVEGLLDYPDENWMRFFSVYDDPPENQPKHRRVRRASGFLCLGAGDVDAVGADLAVEGAGVDAQLFGGGGAVALMLAEGVADQPLFGGGQRQAARFGQRP
jgi:hypothetical protein